MKILQKHKYIGHLMGVDKTVHLWIENPFLWHIESVADLNSYQSNLHGVFDWFRPKSVGDGKISIKEVKTSHFLYDTFAGSDLWVQVSLTDVFET